jgi:hypothetical protein
VGAEAQIRISSAFVFLACFAALLLFSGFGGETAVGLLVLPVLFG